MKLSQICTLKQWKTISKNQLVNDGYPVYGANGIIGYSNEFNHETPTLMIGCRGTCGEIHLSEGKAYINGNAMCLDNLSTEFDINYVKYFLEHYDFSKIITGTAQPQITQQGLDKVQISKIPLEEQKLIASKIANIKELTSIETNAIRNLDSLIKSRFNELLDKNQTHVSKIGDLVDRNIKSVKKTYNSDQEIKYIDIGSIDNKSNQIVSSTTYLVKNAPSRAQQCLKQGDVLVSTVRPNLKNIALFNEANTGYVGTSGFCVLRSLNVNKYFLLHSVLTDDFTKDMVQLTTGASYPAIRDDDILNYEIIVVDINKQNEFGRLAEQIDKLKFNYLLHAISLSTSYIKQFFTSA